MATRKKTTPTKKTTKRASPPSPLSTLFASRAAKATSFAVLFAVVLTSYVFFVKADQPGPTYRVAEPKVNFVNNEISLKFKSNVPQEVQDKLLARFGSRVSQEIPAIGVKTITVPDQALDAVTEALSKNPAVQFAEKNYIATIQATTPNDVNYSGQTGIRDTQTNLAWDLAKGSDTIIVAVLDTGVTNVPDLNGRLTTGYDFWNSDAEPTDDNGHGTASAGVAGAITNNTIGIASYCWNCKIMPVKIAGADGSGSFSKMSQGIIYAADNGAQVINISMSGSSNSSTLASAVAYAREKGVVIVASAGNHGTTTPGYPASTPGVVGVAATTGNPGTLTGYSAFGPNVKIGAPGTNMTTTSSGGYGYFSGTSSAAPAVAGIVALMRGANPAATGVEIEQAVTTNVDACCNGLIGGGQVNAYKAVLAITGGQLPPADTTAPDAVIKVPTGESVLNGKVSVSVSASDTNGVSRVELFRNGVLLGTTTSSPYSFYWDTTLVANGTYSLTAKAYDAAGNVGTSAAVSVSVNNAAVIGDTQNPTVSISSPANGSGPARGNIQVRANGDDNVAVTSMEVYVDGKPAGSSTSNTVSTNLNTKKLSKGGHVIEVRAYDAAGNVGSSSVSITN